MQTLEAELRRQGKGRLSDPRAVHGAVREVVRRSLRGVRELEVPDEATTVAQPVPPVPAMLPSAPKDRDAPARHPATPSGRQWSGPLVVRPREACEMLAVGLTKLYELLNEGALESYVHGGSRRITIASIHAHIDRHLVAGGKR